MRNILLEQLQHVIVTIKEQDDELVAEVEGSPFSKEIRDVPLQRGSNSRISRRMREKVYPQDHLDHFNDLIELHMVSN